MRFDLIDTVLEQTEDRIVARKLVSRSEDYLADHFLLFPLLPGVFNLEAMVQAARKMLADRGDRRLVLGRVRALRFAGMVRPGEAMEVEVTLDRLLDDGAFQCRGTSRVRRETGTETVASGRFTMRPIRSIQSGSTEGAAGPANATESETCRRR